MSWNDPRWHFCCVFFQIWWFNHQLKPWDMKTCIKGIWIWHIYIYECHGQFSTDCLFGWMLVGCIFFERKNTFLVCIYIYIIICIYCILFKQWLQMIHMYQSQPAVLIIFNISLTEWSQLGKHNTPRWWCILARRSKQLLRKSSETIQVTSPGNFRTNLTQ